MPYVLIKEQKGRTIIYPDSVRNTQRAVWFDVGFWWVVMELGSDWQSKYWKRERASRASAKKHGFDIVPCDVILR